MTSPATADTTTTDEHQQLLELIQKALSLSDKLSQNEHDYYARCSTHLYEATLYARNA